MNRDFSVRVNGSIHSETENVFDGLEEWADLKFTEEGTIFF
jgi:hypothetical protein